MSEGLQQKTESKRKRNKYFYGHGELILFLFSVLLGFVLFFFVVVVVVVFFRLFKPIRFVLNLYPSLSAR